MRKDIEIRYPKLYDANGDLNRNWMVYYYVRDPKTGKMKRFQVQEGINRFTSRKARLAAASSVIRRYKRKLEKGWKPWNDPKVKYKPSTEPKLEEPKPTYTISQILSQALNDHKPNIRKKTFQSYESKLKIFTDWLKKNGLNELPVNDFGRTEAQSFLDSLKVHPITLKAYRTTVKGFFNLLLDKEIVLENPFVKTKIPAAQNTQAKRAFRQMEQMRIKAYCQEKEPELWLFIQCIFYCFIRPKEIRFLKVNDVDLDNNLIWIRHDVSKNKKRQAVIIPQPFREALQAHILGRDNKDYLFGQNGCHRSENHFYNKHREVLKALRFESDVSLYSWKHTGVVEFYKKTKDITSLQQQLRHYSLDQVQTYLKSLGAVANDLIKDHFPEL